MEISVVALVLLLISVYAILSRRYSNIESADFDNVVDVEEDPEIYVIVKYAGEKWQSYWVDNPADGVHLNASAHNTYSGNLAQLKPFYLDLDEALRDCAMINKSNPVGDYAVCPVVRFDSSGS